MFDAELYRDKAEVEAWKKKDPIVHFVDVLKERGLLEDSELASLESELEQEIRDAVEFAETGTLEPVEDLTRFVYSDKGGAR
jgi:TPP-dependent pyruvate/acetoin dehydrogenase alpha subunit